jgi:SAM-dependent methyltransferase
MNEYADKIEREKRWNIQSAFQKNHFLNSRLFYSKKRNDFSQVFPKKQFYDLVAKVIKSNNLNNPSMLIAPIGEGSDIEYVKRFSNNISGVDVSEEAINRIIDKDIKTYVCDMKNMSMFKDGNFDIVIVPLFFHHYCRFGFDDFLKEICRVLKPNGHFFALEPSVLYPPILLIKPARKIFGNITGAVEDEMPFVPLKLSRAMRCAGFSGIRIYGASFSHNRFPIWMANINNAITSIFLKCPVIKYFAYMCSFYGKKNEFF